MGTAAGAVAAGGPRVIPCTKDPDRWFPDEDATEEEIDEIIEECFRCPARKRCLEHALEVGEDHGIWGGWTEEARRELSARRRRVTA